MKYKTKLRMKLINKWNEKENNEMKNSMKIKKSYTFLNQEHNKLLFRCFFPTFYLFSFLKSIYLFI